MRITGSCGRESRRVLMTSMPLRPGILRSVTTTWKSPSWAAERHCWESVKARTSWPSCSSTRWRVEAKDFSSSMSRTLLMQVLVVASGQDDAEDRAFAGCAIKFEVAAVFVNDAGGNRQTQTGPTLAFGAEERVKDAFLNLRGNALAGIGHFENGG